MNSDYIHSLPEFDNHNLVTFLNDDETGLEAFVAIHRKNQDLPSFGATRIWSYSTAEEALRDSLRLSRLMSYKAALAGLPCGGAKGVIMYSGEHNEEHRVELIEGYAKKISTLKDSFVTGTDVGIHQRDLATMKAFTPNIIGFNDNTAEFTAHGVYRAILQAVRHVFSTEDLSERSFAIQGIGKVGSELLKLLYPTAGKIFITDVAEDQLQVAQAQYPNVILVAPETIHRQKVDIFLPCALASAINTRNVSEFDCKIIAGCANNQLETEDVGDILMKMDILYAPDYVINAGGLIAVYDEHEHSGYDETRVRRKVDMIGNRLAELIEESERTGLPMNRLANAKAEKIFNNYA